MSTSLTHILEDAGRWPWITTTTSPELSLICDECEEDVVGVVDRVSSTDTLLVVRVKRCTCHDKATEDAIRDVIADELAEREGW